MEHREFDSLSELRPALEAARDEFIRNRIRLEEIAA